jgi:hypothetical protein
MKWFLKLLFGGIFVWMTVVTIRTGLSVSLWAAWPSYAASPWAVATLWSRVLWFLPIMGLGNISTSLYVFIQLFRLRPDERAESILRRQPA